MRQRVSRRHLVHSERPRKLLAIRQLLYNLDIFRYISFHSTFNTNCAFSSIYHFFFLFLLKYRKRHGMVLKILNLNLNLYLKYYYSLFFKEIIAIKYLWLFKLSSLLLVCQRLMINSVLPLFLSTFKKIMCIFLKLSSLILEGLKSTVRSVFPVQYF